MEEQLTGPRIKGAGSEGLNSSSSKSTMQDRATLGRPWPVTSHLPPVFLQDGLRTSPLPGDFSDDHPQWNLLGSVQTGCHDTVPELSGVWPWVGRAWACWVQPSDPTAPLDNKTSVRSHRVERADQTGVIRYVTLAGPPWTGATGQTTTGEVTSMQHGNKN